MHVRSEVFRGLDFNKQDDEFVQHLVEGLHLKPSSEGEEESEETKEFNKKLELTKKGERIERSLYDEEVKAEDDDEVLKEVPDFSFIAFAQPVTN